MGEAPEMAVLVHELGGMLSTVQGFAHIAAGNPGHPDRERFIELTAAEARRAAQTVKDIHLVRALDRGDVPLVPPPVELSHVVDGAPPLMVAVDPPKLAGLLERCLGASAAPAEVSGARVRIPLAPASDLARRVEAMEAPYPDMVLYSILRRLLRLWGGDVTIETTGEWTVAVVAFPEV